MCVCVYFSIILTEILAHIVCQLAKMKRLCVLMTRLEDVEPVWGSLIRVSHIDGRSPPPALPRSLFLLYSQLQ